MKARHRLFVTGSTGFLGAAGCAPLAGCPFDFLKADPPPAPIRTTFAPNPAPDSAFSRLVGHWRRGASGHDLVIVPREEPSNSKARILTGVIPEGPLEGALCLIFDERSGTAAGHYWAADTRLLTRDASVRLLEDKSLQLTITGENGNPVMFERVGDVSTDLLRALPLIGHRALHLRGDLAKPANSIANTRAAIEHAWFFGASGIEVDVVVPWREADGHRSYLLDEAMIYHPWAAGATKCADKIDHNRFPTACEFFSVLLPPSRLTFVYVDIKIADDAVPLVPAHLERIGTLIEEARAAGATADITIAAPIDEVSVALAAWPQFARRGALAEWSWTLELNDEVSCEAVAAATGRYAAWRPDTLSLMLEIVPGNRQDRDGFFIDLDDEQIESLKRTGQRLMLWTVSDVRGFDAALDIRRYYDWLADGQVGLIVKHPHRMVYRMATMPQASRQ